MAGLYLGKEGQSIPQPLDPMDYYFGLAKCVRNDTGEIDVTLAPRPVRGWIEARGPISNAFSIELKRGRKGIIGELLIPDAYLGRGVMYFPIDVEPKKKDVLQQHAENNRKVLGSENNPPEMAKIIGLERQAGIFTLSIEKVREENTHLPGNQITYFTITRELTLPTQVNKSWRRDRKLLGSTWTDETLSIFSAMGLAYALKNITGGVLRLEPVPYSSRR